MTAKNGYLGLLLCMLIGISACSSHPADSCLSGTYTLNFNSTVRLVLHSRQYTLRVGQDRINGTYMYNRKSGTIDFYPIEAKINESSRKVVHSIIEPNLVLNNFFRSLENGKIPSEYDVWQNPNGAVVIIIDPDGIRFTKLGCS